MRNAKHRRVAARHPRSVRKDDRCAGDAGGDVREPIAGERVKLAAMTASVRTHLGIDRRLCGEPVSLAEGSATVRFVATPEMAADDRGLVHGGFVFGLADHAAMLAVNDPFVVLGSAETRFLAPVRVGDEVIASATRTEQKGKKHVLAVTAKVGEREVLSGTMTAFALDSHVLDR